MKPRNTRVRVWLDPQLAAGVRARCRSLGLRPGPYVFALLRAELSEKRLKPPAAIPGRKRPGRL